MSDAVLEMYETLTDEHREEVDSLIQILVEKQEQTEQPFKRDLSEFIGCLTDEDAQAAFEALAECRKIDYGEW